MDVFEQVRRFVEPQSVAIIGASRVTGPGSLNMVENLLDFGFEGRIYPVNPKAKEVLGIKCYSAVKQIPEPADLAVIITPRLHTVEAVKGCTEKGIKAIIVIGQGFADGDDEGKRMQEEMVRTARERGARIMGPNTLGIVNYFSNLNASLAKYEKERPVPITVISQTGVFCLRYPRAIGLGKVFDIGNVGDLSFTDILEYLEDDPETKLIFIYTEGVNDGRKFLEVARRVTRKKPILVMKAGRSEAGRKAAASHTGTLTGEDSIYEAAFKQAGIIRVKSLEEFHDYAKALLWLPPMQGRRVGVVTTTGAGGIMASDACEEAHLQVAALSGKMKKTLEAVYPDWMSVGNPCDIWPAASIMRHGLDNVYRMTLEAMVADVKIDAILALCIAVSYGWGQFQIPAIVSEVAANSSKPIVSWFFGPDMDEDAAAAEEKRTTVSYPTVERAVRALGVLRMCHENSQRKAFRSEPVPIDHEVTREIVARGKAKGELILGVEALEIVRGCGIAIPGYGVARTKREALAVATRLGYPVVMKVLSSDIVHKTESGGVRLGIHKKAEVELTFAHFAEHYSKHATFEGVLVQEMVKGEKELILGMKRDRQFGPVLMVGMGGIYTEIMKDVAFRISPLRREDAYAMVEELKSYPILQGVRGEKPADTSAIVDALLRMSQLSLDFPEIDEIDINPFTLAGVGEGGRAIDARIVLRNPA